MKKILKCLIFIFAFYSCSDANKEEKNKIKKLINSTNINEVVEGYYLVGEEKQVDFIKDIFNNPYDNRISHHYKFKGISVYQSKMTAMKKISGILPPVKIISKSDSLVIFFYYNWALKNNYVSKRVPEYPDN